MLYIFTDDSNLNKKNAIVGTVLLLLLFATIRYLTGDVGAVAVVITLFAFVPSCFAAELFSKEHAKGYMKFLYILPLKRSRLWWIRTATGLIGLLLVIAILSAIVLILPVSSDAPKFITFSFMNVFTWAFLLIGLCINSYALGLLCAGFCQSPIAAVLLNIFMALSLPLVLLYLYLYYGILPTIFDLILLSTISSLPMFTGSYFLFKIRNPFLDQRWKWRKIALMFTLITIVIFALAYEGLGIRKNHATSHYYQGIEYYSISPDGEHVYITAAKSPILSDHYLLDSNGSLVIDMGRLFHSWGSSEFSPSKDGSNYLFYDESYYIYPTHKRNYLPIKVVNISKQEISEIKNLNLSDDEYWYDYHVLNYDEKFLCGLKTKHQYFWKPLAIFKQNISNEYVEFVDTSPQHENMEVTVRFLPKDQALITNKCQYGRGYASSKNKNEVFTDPNETITLVNLNTFSQNVYAVPKYTKEWEITPDGKFLITLQRIPFENYVEYHLISLELSTQKQTTLLKPPDLPRLDFQDFLDDRYINIEYNISPHGRWVSHNEEPNDHIKIRWLIDWQNNKKHKFLEYKNTNGDDPHYSYLSRTIFTKDESRISLAFNHIQNRDTPIEKAWTQIEVYDWNGNGFDKTYSYELPNNYDDFKFLDHNRILFIKPGELKFLSRTDELWVLHLDTGKQHRFFQDNPPP